MSYDWPRNRVTGLDLAAEGFVVITLQYRTNIFGWINVPGSNQLGGNFGLQDQSLALDWIHENVKSLGGNPNQVTLLGHGTSGAPCALLHFILSRQVSPSGPPLVFNQLILMSSGEIEKRMESRLSIQEASKVLVQKLGCQFEEFSQQLVSCLRSKSVSDLLKAFESIYDNGNGTHHLGPSIHINLKEILSNSTIMQNFPPTMMGITSNEGAFLQDYWLELARDSEASLRSYINNTLLEKVFPTQNQGDIKHTLEALNWRYFAHNAEGSPVRLLGAIQTFLSEYYYEIPFYQFLNQISNATNLQNYNSNKIYAYIYDFSNTMDIRGKVNLFNGASHTSDLPLLFGPTLFQQIARRRFNSEEDKMFRKIRTPFINFIKSGNPTPGRTNDAWLPFTNKMKFIYNLGDTWSSAGQNEVLDTNRNNQKIEQLLEKQQSISSTRSRPNRNEFSNSYQIPKTADRATTHIVTASSQNSEYTSHLMRVYGFWQVFLPQAVYLRDGSQSGEDIITQHLLYKEASADAARYKHGFFVMLGLVSLLLALLCLCVYLLRRDPLAPSTHFDCDL